MRRICTREGWEIVAELQDVISGTKFTREGLNALMAMVRHKRVDLIVCHKLDRLGRSATARAADRFARSRGRCLRPRSVAAGTAGGDEEWNLRRYAGPHFGAPQHF